MLWYTGLDNSSNILFEMVIIQSWHDLKQKKILEVLLLIIIIEVFPLHLGFIFNI